MRFLRPVVAAFLVAALASAADTFKPEQGFTALFNGKDLTGWRYPAADNFDGKNASSDGRFEAKDGVLLVHPKTPREIKWLETTREFPRDFVLRLEFRAAPNADSGIRVRGVQLQCRDYLVAGPDKYKQLTKYRPQDWNEIEITVRGGSARGTCNGEVLEEAMTIPATGTIALEGDRGQFEYRRIRFREL